MGGIGDFAYIELDPHALTSSSLGRSQRAVEHLFSEVLEEQAAIGPLIVLIDEVETIATDRSQLSLETNPVDVIRAVDAALIGLDRLARKFSNVLILATSNMREAIDPALRTRADFICEVPAPDAEARQAIIHQTIRQSRPWLRSSRAHLGCSNRRRFRRACGRRTASMAGG